MTTQYHKTAFLQTENKRKVCEICKLTNKNQQLFTLNVCEACQMKQLNLNEKVKNLSRIVKMFVNLDTCEVCGEVFSFEKFLKKYQLSYSDNEPITCEKCINQFSKEERIKRCAEVDLNVFKSHMCLACEATFLSEKSLTFHKLFCNKKENSQNLPKNEKLCGATAVTTVHSKCRSLSKVAKCEVCFKNIQGCCDDLIASNLCSKCKQTHDFDPYSRETRKVNREEFLKKHCLNLSLQNTFCCGACDQKFSSKDALYAHYSVHSENVQLYHRNNKMVNKSSAEKLSNRFLKTQHEEVFV